MTFSMLTIVLDNLSTETGQCVNFDTSAEEADLRSAVRSLCAKYPDEYWAEHDAKHQMAWNFYREFADAGFLGVCIPEEYGDGGAGVTEAAAIVEEVAASGGALNACSMIHRDGRHCPRPLGRR